MNCILHVMEEIQRFFLFLEFNIEIDLQVQASLRMDKSTPFPTTRVLGSKECLIFCC